MPVVKDQVESERPTLLFVHGLGHGAWCWENWLDGAAAAGYPAAAVSLRGHAGSAGSLRGASLGDYVDDVVRTAATFPRQVVLVGHSLGGLVVQRVLARYPARAAVLVAPVPAQPAVSALAGITAQRPLDALRMVVGANLPLRPEYLFTGLPQEPAQQYADRCGSESALAQYQLLFHRPSPPARGNPPMLVLASPQDRLIPLSAIRATAWRYRAQLQQFPGLGHNLMLDDGWQLPLNAMLTWLSTALAARP